MTNKPQQPPTTLPLAVVYLRVSSQRQTQTATDIDADGNSIATQREAAHRKAAELGYEVVREFVEPGASAKTVEKRPVFQHMLAYLQQHPEIDYVIVYARSRAFRNYIDAAITKRTLDRLEVKLLSVREDFGEGIFADAMEGFTDIFNQMQNQLSGEDIRTKMRHKAMNGGTVGRAPLGYLNVRKDVDSHQVNTVTIDPVRGPLIARGFELYATNEYTLERLTETMADLGLLTRPNKRNAEPTTVNLKKWYDMLPNPYYAGYVTHDGERYPGRHEPLISEDLFDAVQQVMADRSKGGGRDRVHNHYLRGLMFCDRCRKAGHLSRLIFTQVRGGRGGQYQYFVCSGRANYKCTLPHLQIPVLEQAIVDHYKTIRPAHGLIDTFRAEVARAVDDSQQTVRDLRTAAAKRLRNIDLQEERLVDALAIGDLPPAPIHRKIRALQLEKARLESNKTDADKRLAIGAHALDMALQLVSVPETTYEQAPDNVRREINGAFFERIWIDEHGDVVESELVPPIRFIVDTYQDAGNTKRPDRAVEASALRSDTDGGPLPFLRDLFEVRGSNKDAVVKARATYSNQTMETVHGSNTASFVELRGIEPRSYGAESGLLRVQSV
jgi:site-specific DNA recombinase